MGGGCAAARDWALSAESGVAKGCDWDRVAGEAVITPDGIEGGQLVGADIVGRGAGWIDGGIGRTRSVARERPNWALNALSWLCSLT